MLTNMRLCWLILNTAYKAMESGAIGIGTEWPLHGATAARTPISARITATPVLASLWP